MQSQSQDRVHSRAIRHALNPRSPPLRLDLVPHFLKALLSIAGLRLEEADAWSEQVERNLDRNSRETAQALRQSAAEFSSHANDGCQLCCLVLTCLASKHGWSASHVIEIIDALDSPRPYFPSSELQRRYKNAWLLKAVETPAASRSEACQKKIVDRLLSAGLASPPAQARRWYHLVLNQWSRDPTDEQRSQLKLLAQWTDLPTAIVLKGASHGEGSDGRSRKKLFTHLELPLPLSVMPMPAATIIETLSSEFPWLGDAIASIALDLLVAENYRRRVARLTPKVLFGEPGNGKTTFVCRVAELLGQATATLSAAGSGSSRILLGVPRGYSSARSSFPLELMSFRKCPNCVINVDEVDKAGTGTQNGSFIDALLGFLEPTSAHRYYDEYALSECDFSHVSWLLTANDLSKLSAPLLSRVEIIHCPQPLPEHMGIIASSTVDAIRKEFGLDRSVEVLDEQAQSEVQASAGRVKSAREMSRWIRTKFAETLERRFKPKLEAPQRADKPRLLLH